jgi:hypothetical protein
MRRRLTMDAATPQAKQPAEADTKSGKTRRWTFEHSKFVVEVIGILVLSVTLFLTYFSVQAAKDAVNASTAQLGETQYESVYQHELDLWRLAAENKDLAPYVVGGRKLQDQVSDAEAKRASQDAAVYDALDFYAYAFEQLAPRDDAGNHPEDALISKDKPSNYTDAQWNNWNVWAATIVGGFSGAPSMCDVLNERSSGHFYYEDDFRMAVSKAVRNCVK